MTEWTKEELEDIIEEYSDGGHPQPEQIVALATGFLRVINWRYKVQGLVNEQTEDEALWSVPAFDTQPIAEAYLQQELRKLHATIEEEL